MSMMQIWECLIFSEWYISVSWNTKTQPEIFSFQFILPINSFPLMSQSVFLFTCRHIVVYIFKDEYNYQFWGLISEAPRHKGRGFCLSAVLRARVRIFPISYSSPRFRLKRRGLRWTVRSRIIQYASVKSLTLSQLSFKIKTRGKPNG